MVAAAQARSTLNWGAPPPRSGSAIAKGILFGLTIAVGVVAAIGSFVPMLNIFSTTGAVATTHVLDRVSNSVTANDELTYRAKYYSNQIFRQLGVTPRPGQVATINEFKLAAGLNPQIAKLYNAPNIKASDENRLSLLTNGAMAAASPIMGVMGLKQGADAVKFAVEASKAVTIAKGAAHLIGSFASVVAGSAIAKALSSDEVDPQALIEAIHLAVAQAKESDMDPRQALTPQLVFMVRVAQDGKFAEEIKENFGGGKKGFHQLDPEMQTRVMAAFPALANAATSEAHAIATGIMPVQELGAMAPNLDSRAAQYAHGTANTTFASRVSPRNQPNSFADAHNARVAASQGQPKLG
jgi:hypothetical protein